MKLVLIEGQLYLAAIIAIFVAELALLCGFGADARWWARRSESTPFAAQKVDHLRA